MERLKTMLSKKSYQNEIVEILIKTEEIRRRLNNYLQQKQIDDYQREILADASEDIYTAERQLGKAIGSDIAQMVMDW